MVNDYRVQLARHQQRDYATAERLQRARVAWDRERAATALATPSAELDGDQHAQLRTLAVGVLELGQILREQQQPACVQAYTEALQLTRRIGNRPNEAIAAYNLGRAYAEVPGLRNLDEAERWFQESLDLHDETDRLGRARCVGQLGSVHYQRFAEALTVGRPEAELLDHLNAAAEAYQQALELLPADAVADLAVCPRPTREHLPRRRPTRGGAAPLAGDDPLLRGGREPLLRRPRPRQHRAGLGREWPVRGMGCCGPRRPYATTRHTGTAPPARSRRPSS